MTIDPTVPDFDTGQFSKDAVTVDDDTDYVEVLRLAVPRRTGAGPVRGELSILGVVGAGGALAHLKLTAAVNSGGTHFDLIEDADFATATDVLIRASATPHQTAAEGSLDLLLARIGAYAEIGLHAKKSSADTTLAPSGRIR
jgi:hypothetical protein